MYNGKQDPSLDKTDPVVACLTQLRDCFPRDRVKDESILALKVAIERERVPISRLECVAQHWMKNKPCFPTLAVLLNLMRVQSQAQRVDQNTAEAEGFKRMSFDKIQALGHLLNQQKRVMT